MSNLVKAIGGLFSMRGLEISVSELDRWMEYAVSGFPSASGAVIGENSSLRLPAVWACVDLISKAGAVLPGHVYRRLSGEDGREREKTPFHYLYPIVHDMANPTLPASEWRRITLAHLLTWGNAYSWIEWKGRFVPQALWVLPPDRVRVTRENVTAPIQYSVQVANGTWQEVLAEDILHIRGLGYDGVKGYTPVGMLRNTFGLQAASEQSAANMHRNGITSRLAVSYAGTTSKEQRDELRATLAEAQAGLANQFKTLILPLGATATPISINPHDAQFLEQWKYGDSKIYQIYGVPPHMVGDTEKATSWGTGIEQQTIGFVTYTLLPWMDLIETWLAVKLLPTGQRTHFVEYDMKGLMRGDSAARSKWYRDRIEDGSYSPNRVLIAENEDPYEGGNVYRRPMNMTFVDSKGTVVLNAPKETEEPEPEAPNEKENEPAAA